MLEIHSQPIDIGGSAMANLPVIIIIRASVLRDACEGILNTSESWGCGRVGGIRSM